MPIFTVDKPYAYETVGDYDSVCFLPSNKPYEWAKKIINICTDKELFDSNLKKKINDPMCSNWNELWTALIQDKYRI